MQTRLLPCRRKTLFRGTRYLSKLPTAEAPNCLQDTCYHQSDLYKVPHRNFALPLLKVLTFSSIEDYSLLSKLTSQKEHQQFGAVCGKRLLNPIFLYQPIWLLLPSGLVASSSPHILLCLPRIAKKLSTIPPAGVPPKGNLQQIPISRQK
ncbi:hypothetical protein GBA52_008400 [Prunus armeniaca]|nr:hypothetical protein GBA52_008400 [Prunus armeniaca]